MIVCLKFPGELVAAQHAILREPCFETATTLTKCSLARWPIQGFMDKLARDRAFSIAVCQLLSRETQELHRRLAGLALRTAAQRLEDFLTEYAASQPSQPASSEVRFSLPLKDRELAEFLSVTPSYLSRLWRQLKREGIVMRNKGWVHVLKTVAGKPRPAHLTS